MNVRAGTLGEAVRAVVGDNRTGLGSAFDSQGRKYESKTPSLATGTTKGQHNSPPRLNLDCAAKPVRTYVIDVKDPTGTRRFPVFGVLTPDEDPSNF